MGAKAYLYGIVIDTCMLDVTVCIVLANAGCSCGFAVGSPGEVVDYKACLVVIRFSVSNINEDLIQEKGEAGTMTRGVEAVCPNEVI